MDIYTCLQRIVWNPQKTGFFIMSDYWDCYTIFFSLLQSTVYKGHFKFCTLDIALFLRISLNLCTHECFIIKLCFLYQFVHILSVIIFEIFFLFHGHFLIFSSVFPLPAVMCQIMSAKTVTLRRWFVTLSFITFHHNTRYWISLGSSAMVSGYKIKFLPLSAVWSSKTLMISKQPWRWTAFKERYFKLAWSIKCIIAEYRKRQRGKLVWKDGSHIVLSAHC